MSWIYLLGAGLFEIGWPLGFQLANQSPQHKILWILFSGGSMIASGFLLFTAQKVIPMGTAYAVWTGIGAAGAFIVGVLVFSEPLNIARFIGVLLIVGGVVTLKVASS